MKTGKYIIVFALAALAAPAYAAPDTAEKPKKVSLSVSNQNGHHE